MTSGASTREAESIEEHELGWLLPLHEAIPELEIQEPGSLDSLA